ncbi:MAG: DUF5412 family protein [Blastocatellales bacterium]
MWRMLFLLFCVPVAGCSVAIFDESSCANDVKQEIGSPDGRYTATAFIRDCGATTDFSPQVYLRRTGERMEKTGNVFIGDHSNEITIRWLSTNELEISSPGKVVRSLNAFEGIKITLR